MPIARTQFQPGNGSNYDILYGMHSPGSYLLVWLDRGGSGGRAFRFSEGQFIAAGYLAEKMDLYDWMADVYALCAFLNTQGHTAEVAGQFDKHGQYIRPNAIPYSLVTQ
jgi:hypothetical protein